MEELAGMLGLPFFLGRVDVAAVARKRGENLEQGPATNAGGSFANFCNRAVRTASRWGIRDRTSPRQCCSDFYAAREPRGWRASGR